VGLGVIYWKLEHPKQQFPYALLESNLQAQSETSAKLTSLQSLITSTSPLRATTGVLGVADLLPDKVRDATTSPTTFVTAIKDSPLSVKAYKEQAEFSTVLGQLIPDYNYPYYTKVNDWYLILLSDGKTGWVKASTVTEVK